MQTCVRERTHCNKIRSKLFFGEQSADKSNHESTQNPHCIANVLADKYGLCSLYGSSSKFQNLLPQNHWLPVTWTHSYVSFSQMFGDICPLNKGLYHSNLFSITMIGSKTKRKYKQGLSQQKGLANHKRCRL